MIIVGNVLLVHTQSIYNTVGYILIDKMDNKKIRIIRGVIAQITSFYKTLLDSQCIKSQMNSSSVSLKDYIFKINCDLNCVIFS